MRRGSDYIFDLEDSMIPILPKGDLEYLKQVFSFSELMRKQHANNDEHIGYMRGVQAVLEVCEALANPPRTEDYGT